MSVWVRFCYHMRHFFKKAKQMKTESKPLEFLELWKLGTCTNRNANALLGVTGAARVRPAGSKGVRKVSSA